MRIESKLEHPCQKDCPFRCEQCKKYCKKLKKYEAARKKERVEIEKIKLSNIQLNNFKTERIIKSRKRNR